MRLIILTTLTMIAFAANSVLNRLALVGDEITPANYALIRLCSGAFVLWLILSLRGVRVMRIQRIDYAAVLGLAVYAIGFSFAYITLDTGLGALLLFGGVQITMFVGSLVQGANPKPLQWVGSIIGLCGLAYVLNPSLTGVDLWGAFLMLCAAIGWGIYTLRGKIAPYSVVAAAQSFLYATPLAMVVYLLSDNAPATYMGIGLAVLSGGVFSGLGYLLWYEILPRMRITTAAVAQLTVPIIAAIGGYLVLSEPLTMQFAVASLLVLGGIGLSIWAGR